MRQSPNQAGIWEDIHFISDQLVSEYDFWLVYDGLMQEETAICSSDAVFFLPGEALGFRKYNPAFLKQFHGIITPRNDIEHQNIIHSFIPFYWHAGIDNRRYHNLPSSDDAQRSAYDTVRTYDYYKNLDWTSQKSKTCSFMSSSKSFLPGHLDRVEFLRYIANRVRSGIDIFGAGIFLAGKHVDVIDKESVILPYKYHIAIENGVMDGYFTEKILDAYLCGALPIYHGCPDLERYFPPESFVRIDATRPEDALRIIVETLNSDRWERSKDAIAEARRRVLDEWNFFPLLKRLAPVPQHPKTTIRLLPENAFA